MLNPLNTTFMRNWNIEHVGLPKFPLFRCIHQICIYECTYRSIHKHIHLHHHSWWTINFYFIFIRLLTFAPSPTRDYKLGGRLCVARIYWNYLRFISISTFHKSTIIRGCQNNFKKTNKLFKTFFISVRYWIIIRNIIWIRYI